MKLLKLAILPAAVMLMGFSDKTLDTSDGDELVSSLRAILKPLSKAEKDEFMRAIYVVPFYHRCEETLATYKTRNPSAHHSPRYDVTKCGRGVKNKALNDKEFLKTGRMDANVFRKVTTKYLIGRDTEKFLGHSKEESWQKFAERSNKYLNGRSANSIMAEYRNLRDTVYPAAVTQYDTLESQFGH